MRKIAAKWSLVGSEHRSKVVASGQRFRELAESMPDVFVLGDELYGRLIAHPESWRFGKSHDLMTFLEIAPGLRAFLPNASDALACVGLLNLVDFVPGFDELNKSAKSRKAKTAMKALNRFVTEDSKAHLGGAYLLVLCRTLAESRETDAVAVSGLIDMNSGGCIKRVRDALTTVGVGDTGTSEVFDTRIDESNEPLDGAEEGDQWIGLVQNLVDIPIERRSNRPPGLQASRASKSVR